MLRPASFLCDIIASETVSSEQDASAQYGNTCLLPSNSANTGCRTLQRCAILLSDAINDENVMRRVLKRGVSEIIVSRSSWNVSRAASRCA